MTKKDFALIAATVRALDLAYPETREHVAMRFAAALRGTSPRFDRVRFIAACVGTEGDA